MGIFDKNLIAQAADLERRKIQRKERADKQIELKDVIEALNERDEEIKAFCEKAAQEIADFGKIRDETRTMIEGLSKSGLELTDRLTDLEQRLDRRGKEGEDTPQTLGDMFAKSDEFAQLARTQKGHARIQGKAVADITSAVGSFGAAITPTRLPGIQQGPEREFTIRDLIMPGRTASNSVEFVRETGFTNSAAPTAEGMMKPQSDITIEDATAQVRTIAHWFRVTKQVLADVPLLVSYINTRAIYGLKYEEEQQILAGDGTGQNLLGLIPQATPFNTNLRVAGDTRIDTLRRAILQVRMAEYRASGIALNPLDWAEIELQKDANGSYIWVNVQEGGVQRLWKLPVVDSMAVPEGEFLVGAMNIAAQVFDREDAAVELSTEDGDNFRTNRVTIRAEERLALVVHRPESFVHGAFAAA